MKGILVSTHDQIYPTHTANDHPHQVRAFQAHAGVFAATMVLILAVGAAVVAAWYPASKASRMDVLQAIATD